MDSSVLSSLNFSSQESLFPGIPSDENPFIPTLDAINYIQPAGTHSDAMLAQYLIGIIILGVGIFMSLATLIISWINARRSGKSFNLIRKIQRIHGTYYTVENVIFIPLTMFFYWTSLFVQMVLMMMLDRFGRSMINTILWLFLPFTILFIQGHGFAFSILIGGIITSEDVWTTRKFKLPSPWILNFLQGLIAIATITTSIYFSIKINNLVNEEWTLYSTAAPILEAAADSWVANEALNATLSEPAYIAVVELAEPFSNIVNNLRKTLIVWLFVVGLPLLTLAVAAVIVLRALHSYITILTSDISGVKEQETTSATAAEVNSSVVNRSFWTPESRQLKQQYGLQKCLRQMQNLRKKLAIRMFGVCLVSMTYTVIFAVLIAKYHFEAGSSNSQLAGLFYLISISFPWTSIIYGSIVIVAWFRAALKKFREVQAKDTVMSLSGKIGGTSSSYTDPSTFQSLSDKDAIVNHEKYTISGIEITHTSYSVKEELHDIPMKTFKGNPVAY